MKGWSDKLNDALQALHTTHKAPIGMSTYRRVFGKPCYLPIKLEYWAYWDLKNLNLDLNAACEHRKYLLNKLEELCTDAYDITKD